MSKKDKGFKSLLAPVVEEVQFDFCGSDVELAPIVEVEKSIFDFYLVVRNPFGGYSKGQMITEDLAIQKIIDDGSLPNCLKVKRP